MRVGIDIRSLLEPYPSGVSEYTWQIVKNLITQDRVNTYLLFCNSRRGLPARYRTELQGQHVRIVERHVPNKMFNAGLFFLGFPKIDRLLGGVDLFFLPNFNFIALSAACKKVVMVHDLSFRYQDFYSRRGRWWHRFIRPAQRLREADMIVCPSEATKRDIMRWYGVASGRIRVIPLAVDVPAWQTRHPTMLTATRATYHLHKPFFLFIGTVETRKNIEGVLRAWAVFQRASPADCELVVAGVIKAKKLIRAYPHVHFLGYVPPRDKVALYQLALAFIYPSFYEGFGLPVWEAMAAGLPVITSFSTSLPEIAGGAAIIVDPYNIKEISWAMQQIASNPALRQACIEQGRQLVSRYTWSKTAAATLDVFKTVLNS
jgi:glycosyltransferase involved in cell wall biosynthesis